MKGHRGIINISNIGDTVVYGLENPNSLENGFVIRPNRAMSWQAIVLVYLGIVVFSMSIAISFYAIGLTLILPFSGLELLALGIAFYVCALRGDDREVITISDNTVIVESGRHYSATRQEFQRSWVNVALERSWNSWYPSRLLIRSHGREVEIGRCLNEQERQGLAQELRNVFI